MKVKVSYAGNSLEREYEDGTTLRTIIGDSSVRAALRAGDNIAGYIGGIEQSLDTVLQPTMNVDLRDKGCAKQQA